MNKKQELLTITMEECGELIQACSKLIRFEEDSCQDEIGDLICMIELIKQEGLVNEEKIRERMEVKKEKLKKWSNLFNEV